MLLIANHGRWSPVTSTKSGFGSFGSGTKGAALRNWQGSEGGTIIGRQFVVDLELAGDFSMLTVYEADIPRFKKAMPAADVDRLLEAISDFAAGE